jgi:hypothetical protein
MSIDAALQLLTHRLRSATSLGDASDIFNVVERILSDALDQLNAAYSAKVNELHRARTRDATRES